MTCKSLFTQTTRKLEAREALKGPGPGPGPVSGCAPVCLRRTGPGVRLRLGVRCFREDGQTPGRLLGTGSRLRLYSRA